MMGMATMDNQKTHCSIQGANRGQGPHVTYNVTCRPCDTAHATTTYAEHFLQAEVAYRNRQGSFLLFAHNAGNRANRLKFADARKITLVPVAWMARAVLK